MLHATSPSLGRMRVRLSDIATQSGVSTATVSRVLNGKTGVAADTREAVLAALDVLGYDRPPQSQRRSNGLIGLIVPELENPIFPAFAQAAEAALNRKGFTPLLCTQRPGGVAEDEYIEMLLEHTVSGIIFVSGRHADTKSDKTRYLQLCAAGIPIVLINGYSPEIPAPSVSADDKAAVESSVNHLASLGHTRIGLAIGPDRFVPTARKIAQFYTSILARFPDYDPESSIRRSLFTVEGGQAAGGDLIDQGHTAIICGSDMMALGAIMAARARGLLVPQEISVIGYDDSPLIAHTDPPITTVRQPVVPMANAAVTTLVEAIQGNTSSPTEFLFQPELVVRSSTAAFSARNRRG